MNDEGRPPERPRHRLLQLAESVPRRAARTTGLQAAQLSLARQLEGWREIFSPREYATLLDLHRRWLERELAREERALRRWAA